jgi:ech hydrogenase subunit A
MEFTVADLMTTPLLLFLLIALPFLAALCLYQLRSLITQSLVVTIVGAVLAAGAMLLVPRMPFGLSIPAMSATYLHGAVNGADFLLLCVILYFGFKYRHPLIEALSVLQIIVLAVLLVFSRHGNHPAQTFYGDDLALMLVMIASIAIALSTLRLSFIPSLQALEENPELKQASRHRFFALLLLCLGAFNGVLLSNDMSFFYFFFELITICSFLLIAQKGTPAAEKKAVRTLSMTSLAGLVLLLVMT